MNTVLSYQYQWLQVTPGGTFDACRPVWQVIQAFNHNNTCCPSWPKDGMFRTPSLPELRSMAWQAICGGANGVVFYSFFEALKPSPQNLTFHEQWDHLTTAAAEIAPHGELLLGEPAPAPEHDPNSPWRMTRAHWVDGAVAKVYMLYAVSDGNGGGPTAFKLRWPIATVELLVPGSATRVARTIQPVGTRLFHDNLPPLGFAAYRVTLQHSV